MSGHESTDVRRASLRLIHVYMRYTNNLQRVLKIFIQYGLESKDSVAQKGVVVSLPLLFTEEFSNENLYLLVESLAKLLISADTNLFYPVFLAMQRLHSIIGNEVFKKYLETIDREAVSLYRSVLSRNSTANSTGKEYSSLLLIIKFHFFSILTVHWFYIFSSNKTIFRAIYCLHAISFFYVLENYL